MLGTDPQHPHSSGRRARCYRRRRRSVSAGSFRAPVLLHFLLGVDYEHVGAWSVRQGALDVDDRFAIRAAGIVHLPARCLALPILWFTDLSYRLVVLPDILSMCSGSFVVEFRRHLLSSTECVPIPLTFTAIARRHLFLPPFIPNGQRVD